MCEIQRCFSGECEGSWDCCSAAVVEVSFPVEGGFFGVKRVRRYRKCMPCYLKWCNNRRRKGLPLSEEALHVEEYFKFLLERP